MNRVTTKLLQLSLPLALVACGASENESAPTVDAAAPSSMAIGSAKRQCVMQASLGLDLPRPAITSICGCSIDKLVATGKFTSTAQPSETDAEQVLEGCITSFLEGEEAAEMLEEAGA